MRGIFDGVWNWSRMPPSPVRLGTDKKCIVVRLAHLNRPAGSDDSLIVLSLLKVPCGFRSLLSCNRSFACLRSGHLLLLPPTPPPSTSTTTATSFDWAPMPTRHPSEFVQGVVARIAPAHDRLVDVAPVTALVDPPSLWRILSTNIEQRQEVD
jgi:hypothetical protein